MLCVQGMWLTASVWERLCGLILTLAAVVQKLPCLNFPPVWCSKKRPWLWGQSLHSKEAWPQMLLDIMWHTAGGLQMSGRCIMTSEAKWKQHQRTQISDPMLCSTQNSDYFVAMHWFWWWSILHKLILVMFHFAHKIIATNITFSFMQSSNSFSFQNHFGHYSSYFTAALALNLGGCLINLLCYSVDVLQICRCNTGYNSQS